MKEFWFLTSTTSAPALAQANMEATPAPAVSWVWMWIGRSGYFCLKNIIALSLLVFYKENINFKHCFKPVFENYQKIFLALARRKKNKPRGYKLVISIAHLTTASSWWHIFFFNRLTRRAVMHPLSIVRLTHVDRPVSTNVNNLWNKILRINSL